MAQLQLLFRLVQQSTWMGTAIYLAALHVFIAQITGVTFGMHEYFVILTNSYAACDWYCRCAERVFDYDAGCVFCGWLTG